MKRLFLPCVVCLVMACDLEPGDPEMGFTPQPDMSPQPTPDMNTLDTGGGPSPSDLGVDQGPPAPVYRYALIRDETPVESLTRRFSGVDIEAIKLTRAVDGEVFYVTEILDSGTGSNPDSEFSGSMWVDGMEQSREESCSTGRYLSLDGGAIVVGFDTGLGKMGEVIVPGDTIEVIEIGDPMICEEAGSDAERFTVAIGTAAFTMGTFVELGSCDGDGSECSFTVPSL